MEQGRNDSGVRGEQAGEWCRGNGFSMIYVEPRRHGVRLSKRKEKREKIVGAANVRLTRKTLGNPEPVGESYTLKNGISFGGVAMS